MHFEMLRPLRDFDSHLLDYKYEVFHGTGSFERRNDLSVGHSASMSTWSVYHGSLSRTANKFVQFFHLNCCRIYLQVVTMADIKTADGKQLRHTFLKCEKSRDRTSRMIWPNQSDPTDQQKADWKAALISSCLLKSSKNYRFTSTTG